MAEDTTNDESSLNKKLDELIESKKDESSALRKIFESFTDTKKDNSDNKNQKK